MTLVLNWKKIKQKLPNLFERLGQTMLFEFIDLNYSPVDAVNCDNRKVMGKEKWCKISFPPNTSIPLFH